MSNHTVAFADVLVTLAEVAGQKVLRFAILPQNRKLDLPFFLAKE